MRGYFGQAKRPGGKGHLWKTYTPMLEQKTRKRVSFTSLKQGPRGFKTRVVFVVTTVIPPDQNLDEDCKI